MTYRAAAVVNEAPQRPPTILGVGDLMHLAAWPAGSDTFGAWENAP